MWHTKSKNLFQLIPLKIQLINKNDKNSVGIQVEQVRKKINDMRSCNKKLKRKSQ